MVEVAKVSSLLLKEEGETALHCYISVVAVAVYQHIFRLRFLFSKRNRAVKSNSFRMV